ncbi:alpha/beta hydrolase [Nitrospinae bacterium AH_259_B05_G02_I21]|nr:alpha/beta hydrolase [Nitrospinae bacterium AH_259_B05_G02_I21]MDA2932104.1 alpha/beta hydrolase [Nitrospinae bacterium AH-259-F20]
MKTKSIAFALFFFVLAGCQQPARKAPQSSGTEAPQQYGYVAANGQKLYFEIHGKGEPLVLIQGLGSDATNWEPQILALQEHFTVITFDNRDVGRSSQARGPYSIADMAEDTAGLMDALGIEQAHVLGASMGGMIAQELVFHHPAKVRTLILAATVAQVARFHVSILDPWKWMKQHDFNNEVFHIEKIVWGMTHEFLKNAEAVDQLIERLRNPQFPVSPEAFGRQADAVRAFDALDRLGAVSVPTLVMVGDQDILAPPWLARELVAAIPGAKLKILEGGGHGFFLEIPDKVNQAIIEFLKTTQRIRSSQ